MTTLNDFLNNFSNIENILYPEYNFLSKKRMSKKDLIEEFLKNWELSGGKGIKISSKDKKKILYEILKLNFFTENSIVYTVVSFPTELLKNYPITLLQEKQIQKPQDFDNLDILIIEAEIGVANQGAVWIPKNLLIFDSALFLCKYQIILLNKKNLYKSIEEALAKWQKSIKEGGYWISGPSKTADIEQSLVIGAHGPLISVVLVY